eukprot:11199327-Lingulodinium_polyedra.AAC.1
MVLMPTLQEAMCGPVPAIGSPADRAPDRVSGGFGAFVGEISALNSLRQGPQARRRPRVPPA